MFPLENIEDYRLRILQPGKCAVYKVLVEKRIRELIPLAVAARMEEDDDV